MLVNIHIGVEEEQYYEENTLLIHHALKPFAPRFKGLGVEYEDAFQIASIAFSKSYRGFDPSGFTSGKGKFSTYAVPYMQGAIRNLLTRELTSVKYSRGITDNYHKAYFQELLEETPIVISDKLGISVSLAVGVLEYHRNRTLAYLDKPVNTVPGGDGEQVMVLDTIEDNRDGSADYLEDFMSGLPPRHQDTLRLRLEGLSQAEIGQALNVSQAEISRKLKKIGQAFKAYMSPN
jgi:RNA polymerase sigma factor (sigma-70 family)